MDVEYICREVKAEEIQIKDTCVQLKYQKAKVCELPDRWVDFQEPEKDKMQPSTSAGSIQEPQQSHVRPEKPPDQPKPTGGNQQQLPRNVWPPGPYGHMSGIYQNIPLFSEGNVDGNQKIKQDGMPQRLPMSGHGQGQSPKQEKDNKSHHQAFTGHDQSLGHGPAHVPHQIVHPNQNFPFGREQCSPGFPLFAMPGNYQIGQQNVPGGQKMPFQPRMPIPMFIDPQTGQMLPFPVAGFPRIPNQQADAGGAQRKRPTGQPPPYDGVVLKDQNQCYSTVAKSTTDPFCADGHQTDAMNEDLKDERTEEPEIPEEKPRKIMVTNLPLTLHEGYLEMYFENARKFGGDVTVVKVDLDEDNTSAIVEFDKPEGVDVILSKCPLIMMGKEVKAIVYKPEAPVPLCTIEVTGPCSVVSQEQLEILEMYFESERRSGGGDIVDRKFDSEMNMALITFKHEEVAKRVEERGNHIIKKETIKVSLHSPIKQLKRSDETENVQNKANPSKTIKVTGVGKLASKDTVEFYFENSRRSGGGEIENMKIDEEDEDAIYITFKSKQDAISVVKRGLHTVEGKELNVALYVPPVPPPSCENKMLIKGVKPTTTQDCLFNFIEAKTEYSPETMDYHAEQEDVVMVTFKDKPDIQELEKIFGKNKLEGASLKVYPVPMSNCIIVTNLTSDISKDTVSFYFENTRKSGGGQVDKVVMNEDDTCLVYFADYTTIDRVIDRNHELSKQKLDVKRYQECLGRQEGNFCERKLTVPEPLKMKNVNPHKLKLLKHSKFFREALEKELLNCHARVLLPTDVGDVTLKCTLTKDVETCFKLVKTWEKGAKECFDQFLNTISVHQIRVLQDVWEKVVERLKSITIKSPETVAVFVDENDRYVTVVGDKTPTESHAKKLQKVVEEAEMEQQQVKETFNSLKSMETKLLLVGKFPSKVEEMFPELKVKINLEQNEIVFEGSLANVRDAKLKLYEVKSEYAQKSIENISTHAAELLKDKHTTHYIVKKLKMQRVTGVWDIQDHTLIIISSSEKTIDHCVSIIRESVVEKSIRLTKSSTSVMNSEAWQRKVENLHSQHYGKTHITIDDSLTEVVICSTDDIANEILDHVKSFLGSNVVLEETVQCNKYLHKLVEKHHKNAISEICKQLRSYHVTITSEEYGGCRICGTEDGIIRSKELLNTLFNKVKQKYHKTVKSGVVKETKKHSGQEDFSTAENSMLHIISVKDEWDEGERSSATLYDRNPAGKENGNKAIQVRASCKAYGNRNVYTAVGDVTDMPVQVLVYAADEKRSLSDGLGKAMVLRGKLKADYIIHVIGPVWSGGVNNEEEKLEETAFKCMQEATTHDATSIALPAVSCGAFGYPVKQGTRSIVKAVKNFIHEVQESQLTDIYLCDVKSNIVDSFTDELQNEFGEIQIEEQSEDLNQRMAEIGSDDINEDSMYTSSSRLKKSPQCAVRGDKLQHDGMDNEQGDRSEELEKQTKIVVSNLPSTVQEEYLEMFFENKKKFGGGTTVFHVDFDEETSTAVVEFDEEEAVDIVLGKCPIQMMGQEVEVAVYRPEPPVPLCTIEVTGPCNFVCQEQLETLEMYFESEKRSDGGDIVDSKFDSENNMVLITFEDEEVAKRVEERGNHVVNKATLTVMLHTPTKQSKKSDKREEKEETFEDKPEISRTIKVKGVDKAASRETVEFYFENSRISGGGEIEEINSDEEEEDVIYVTFKKTQDAQKIANNSDGHKVEGKLLSVSLYVPPPSYENKILIKGLNPSTTEDCLLNFIEAKTRFIPETMDYHADQEGVVMVTFTDNIDFSELAKVFARSKLEGASLKVYPVPISNCIIVDNLASDVTEDTVEFYFENTRKSGGGPVNKVVKNEDDTFLVYFADYTIIDKILQRKHELSKQRLDVKRYQECIGRPEGEFYEKKLYTPDVLDGVKEFLRYNTVLEEKVTCIKNVHRLIETHHKHEIGDICKQLQSYRVNITSNGYGGFRICGTEDGMFKSKEMLNELFDRVKHKDHTVEKPGLVEHMKTPRGKDNLNTIESMMPCVISVKDECGEDEMPGNLYFASRGNKTIEVKAGCKVNDDRSVYTAGKAIVSKDSTYANLTVTVKQGDITKEDSDCIVNSSNDTLDLNRGAVSKALLQKGGATLKREIESKKDIMGRQHLVWTSAPGIPCNQIVHIVAQDNNKGWKAIIERCLHGAEKKKLKSITFPALGTGFQSDPKEMADVMACAFLEFDKTKPAFLREVRVVVFQKEMVKDFQRVHLTDANQSSEFFKALYRGLKGMLYGSKEGDYAEVGPGKKKKKKQENMDSVTFEILSMNNNVIQEAIKRLEGCLEKEIHRKEFKESIICRMDPNFIAEIEAIARENNVQINTDVTSGTIKISGMAENPMNASGRIHGILRDAVSQENQRETAMIMSCLVQWFYIEIPEESGLKLVEYDKPLNFKIENAFKQQAPTFSFVPDDKNKYIIDYKKMQEYAEDDAEDAVNVIRRDLFKEGTFDTPASWGDFKGNLKVVNLPNTDPEYQDISQKFQATAGTPRQIKQIQRIQNKTLWNRYHAKKKQLEDQNPPNTKNEQFLWHGTAEDAVDSINALGCNRSYCGRNATALGNGVYFAVKAAYSCQDTYSRPDRSGVKRMYYCRVLTGEYTRGQSGMRIPPPKPSGGSNAIYDSVVDNVNGPGMYIIFSDNQAYPEYLVTFAP